MSHCILVIGNSNNVRYFHSPMQGHYSATAPRMGKRGMQREGQQPGFRHWGSSLSLASDDPGQGEITRRTLRPPSPKPTRDRDPIPRTAKPVLPLLTQEEVRHPRLQDYLEKPRLHGSTMSGLQQQKQRAAHFDYGDREREFSPPSEHHARRLANGDVPVYRSVGINLHFPLPSSQPAGFSYLLALGVHNGLEPLFKALL